MKEDERFALALLDVVELDAADFNLCRLNVLSDGLCAVEQTEQEKKDRFDHLSIIRFLARSPRSGR